MALIFILLVLATPFIEISLFIKVGSAIGVLPTLALTILSTMAGLAIVRGQGISNLQKMQKSVAREEVPIAEIVHAMFLGLAGFLLAIPGFFTDTLGLLLLLPPVRAGIGIAILSRLRQNMTRHMSGDMPGQSRRRHNDDSVIVDAEYWEEPAGKSENGNDDRKIPPPRS